MDDDQNLNPENSPSEQTQDQDIPQDQDQNTEGDGNQDPGTPGKRSAEARIDQLVSEVKSLQDKLTQQEQRRTPPPPPNVNVPEVPAELRQAAEILKGMGFVHKDELSKRDQVMEERMSLNSIHGSLEGRYTGSDGRPKYDRTKIEDYMRNHGVYDPEAAYKLMNETELFDYAMKQAQKPKQKPSAFKPGSTGGATGDNTTITMEKIKDAVNNPTPASREWYERNRSKIHDLLAKGQL